MSSKSKKGSKSGNAPQQEGVANRLPFEPVQARKKTPPKTAPVDRSIASTPEPFSKSADRRANAIPEVVSRRMARRMAYLCGVPTSLGILTFAVCYVVVSQGWLKIPNVVVVLLSMGCFGLGVLGLSYGVISASWDEERVGSLHGWDEFTTNFGRLTQAWREARETKQKPNP